MEKLTLGLLASTLLISSIQANEISKVSIKGNMNLSYKVLPQNASSVNEAFENGVIYGRLRSNIFFWDWDKEIDNKQKDHKLMGIGGSVVYKTAPLNGFSLTTAFYTSQVPGFMQMDNNDVGFAKAGKDTFSRNEIKNGGTYDGDYGLNVIGQAYIEANRGSTVAKVGRQLVHTVFTASNDTKMIPNTFDGITLTNKTFPKTTITAAYLTAQKLRDHTSSHDVLAYDSWNENDDSGVNKSLTKSLIGNDNKLIIASVSSKMHQHHTHKLSIASVPDVLTTGIFETDYTFKLDNGLKVIPAIRYINQQDNLDSISNVANLKANTTGYTNPTSLDASAFMAKVDIKKDAWKLRLGYSKIDDKADLVAPWRGFPTGGYTRAMAQYNWYANTKTYMIRADYDFGKAGIAKDLTGLIRYAVQDFDDDKDLVQADSNVIHFDLVKKLSENLYTKLRVGLVDGKTNTKDINGDTKSDISYNEYRFEINYLF